jgi:hypothetical protein
MAAPGLGVWRRPRRCQGHALRLQPSLEHRLRAARLLASPGASLGCKIKRSGAMLVEGFSWAELGGRVRHQDPVFPYLGENQLVFERIFE